MHVLEPKELEKRRHHRAKKQKTKKHKRKLLPVVIVVLAVYVVAALLAPLPALKASAVPISLPATQTVSVPWPSYGEEAVGAVGYGLLAQNGDQKPVPIASVAKILTAVAVLKLRPLSVGSQGPIITLTDKDVATYNTYVAEDQSVVKVQAGEQLTEYQALQAMLLPSANNMADVLAVWAFGSIDNYLAFANPFTKTLGMQNTTIADASGFSPQTLSTATDLTKLAEIAMNQPIVAQIVAQSQATVPVAGTVFNVDPLIGQYGLDGIKTGNTDQAGGCFLFAAKRKIDATHTITVVGAVMEAPDLPQAIKDSLPILDEAFKDFKVITPIHADQVVGAVSQTGGAEVPIVIRQGTDVVVWTDQALRAQFTPATLSSSNITAGDPAGSVTLYIGNMTYNLPAMAGGTIGSRTILWRLQHAGGRI